MAELTAGLGNTSPLVAELGNTAPLVAESVNTAPLTAEEDSNKTHRSAEELVAKAIAPIKREFLRPPPIRPCSTTPPNGAASTDVANTASNSSLVKEKKSKRQMKRERRQEQKSAANVCPEVAKTGEVSSCAYGDKCRLSHDIEAFKAQKPADLEGECPFMVAGVRCRYGLSCRFAGTHKEGVDIAPVTEVNGLNKNVQKLLWKNKMKFPKADAKLKELGLLNKAYSKAKDPKEEDESAAKTSHMTNGNGCCEVVSDSCHELNNSSAIPEEDNANGGSATGELRPQKKVKLETEEGVDFDGVENGNSAPENDLKLTGYEAMITDPVPENDRSMKLHPREKKLIDFRDKLYLAPLTTVGNLPFRRVCKVLGADVTCGEMAMCTNLLQGQASEWALLRRHSSEDLFGVQICGAYPDTVTRAVELIAQECTVDFIDINMGCPIDLVVNKGAGSALINKPMRMKSIIEAASSIVDIPMTVKVRTGYFEGKNRIDSLIADICEWGTTAVTVHGRTRQQRYSKLADWDYIYQCARKAPNSLQVLGNGDVCSYTDWNKHKAECPELASLMIARGALIKPWLFTEIKEQRHWDISSGERFNILKDYVRFGLQHWGSDKKGVETTRYFLLEWLSYTCRYIPVGLLDVIPQCLNWRPPSYCGRDDLESLMASDSAADWIRISEMLLGKVPDGFTFAPKHKSNAYDKAENG